MMPERLSMATQNKMVRSFYWFLAILFLYALKQSFEAVEISIPNLVHGLPHMWDFLQRMYPPNWSVFPRVYTEVVVTIQLALVATTLAMFVSVPLAFLASKNVVQNLYIVRFVRFILSVDRAIDALILAMFFAAALGLGPFPGTLALAIHSVGMLGQILYQAIENVDRKPIEAMEAVGASRLNVIRWGILPQVMPYVVSYYLLRFELNIRSAVVLGVVGAGGVGFLLQNYMKLFQYENVCVVVLTILGLVMAIDTVSTKIRSKLI